jgi:D-lactate dehydrogenase
VVAGLETLFRESLPPAPRWLRGVAKNSSGLRVWEAWDGTRLDPVELLVSSEGTLAVLTEIELATAPLPGGRALVLAAFRSLDDLARAVERVLPLHPSGVEFLDATFLEALRAEPELARVLPGVARAVLYVETEGESPEHAAAGARLALEAVAALALPGARLAPDEAAGESLWRLRRGASPSLARLHPGRATQQFVEDCAVLPGALPELLRGLRRVFAEEGIPVVLFGHAGESHVHANPLFDPADPHLRARVDRIAGRVCDLIETLGGTLSGEHGDGLARAAFAGRRFGAAAAFFGAVRAVCDPDGILNPGKVLPAPGWRTGRDLRLPWERRSRAARERWRRARTAPAGGQEADAGNGLIASGGGIGPSPGDGSAAAGGGSAPGGRAAASTRAG